MHVYELKIISDQIFLFLCFLFFCFCFVFSENAYRGFFNSFFNPSSCVFAFLLFCGLGALFLRPASPCACSLVFLHGVDSKAYLAAALWCCGFMVLWLWTLGPVVAHTFHSFPIFLPCNLYLPVSSVLLSSRALGPHLHCAVVLYFCDNAIYSPAGLWFCAVLFPWGFG